MTGNETTIDWCEENYVVMPEVAEFWNTLTSVLCIVPPLLFFFQRTPDGVGMIPWMYPLIAFIMVGSALFHGTLTWFGQLLDEVPILAFISFSFSATLDSITIVGKEGEAIQRRSWAPGPRALLDFGLFQVTMITVLYTTKAKAYGLFLGCAVAQALSHWPLILWELSGRLKPYRKVVMRMLAMHVGLGYGGYAIWCLENAFCERLRFLQLHAWWHPLATMSLKPFIDLLLFQRLVACGEKPAYRPTYLGFGPSVVTGLKD
mmetsp:Transcript_23509/g.51566  ORF Transcript_23509/g.51566 Transcript_23509/m.51566 type:complete len:261 (-) Transcript_23509:262-1044(-)